MVDVWSRFINDSKKSSYKTETVIDKVKGWGCLNPVSVIVDWAIIA